MFDQTWNVPLYLGGLFKFLFFLKYTTFGLFLACLRATSTWQSVPTCGLTALSPSTTEGCPPSSTSPFWMGWVWPAESLARWEENSLIVFQHLLWFEVMTQYSVWKAESYLCLIPQIEIPHLAFWFLFTNLLGKKLICTEPLGDLSTKW